MYLAFTSQSPPKHMACTWLEDRMGVACSWLEGRMRVAWLRGRMGVACGRIV
jgi:predicted 3-demethylubiquinone-9 3-methyltransferase (glyoxalase superfamily)